MFFKDCTHLYAALANYNSREGIVLVLHFPSQIHSVITDTNSKSRGPPPLPYPYDQSPCWFFSLSLLQSRVIRLCQKRNLWSWMLILVLFHFFCQKRNFWSRMLILALFHLFMYLFLSEEFLVLNVDSCFIALFSQGSIGGPELSVTWFWAVSHLVMSCQSLGSELSVIWFWAVGHLVLSCQSLGSELSVTLLGSELSVNCFWAVSHLVLSCQSLGVACVTNIALDRLVYEAGGRMRVRVVPH